jgi:hypothetical protein
MVETPVHPADTADIKVELRLGLNFPVLTAAYSCWQGQGMFESIFWRTPNMGLFEFLKANYQPTCEPVGCYDESDPENCPNKMIGIGWICKAFRLTDGRTVAEVGAAFFKGTSAALWHRGLDLFVRHAFVDRGYDAIYGLSQISSQESAILAGYCGMTEVTGFPWEEETPAGAIVRGLTKHDWEMRQ